MAQVRLQSVKKSYGQFVALQNISIEIASGHFFTLLGPSGCGKTTLLRAIAGFHPHDSGEIFVGDQNIGRLPANMRDVGMVFQDYAVFPHLSVFDNVAFGLVQRKVSHSQIKERVGKILETVQLSPYADRMPHQLSGGQQQRVGLARALVIRPKVLLMDEPLSNLDAKLRVDLRRDIRSLQQEFGITTIYVTHDQEEALAMSDRVCVMHDGVVQQMDAPWGIYNKPANRFVATFVGTNNFLSATVSNGRVDILGQSFAAPNLAKTLASCVVSIRPEYFNVHIQAPGFNGNELQFCGILKQSMFTGRELQLSVAVPHLGVMEAFTTPSAQMTALQIGQSVTLTVPIAKVLCFDNGDVGALLP